MSRNGIGIIYYFTSIWNSGTYIIELNKKIGYFIKMFVCTELHKAQNSLRPDEKKKLINFINQVKEIKKTLILSDTEEPTLEEFKTYLGTVYKLFEEEEKKGIINSTTPNKLRLIGDLIEPLKKFNALDGPYMKLQQYERYKAKMYEEGLKKGIKPVITSLSAFRYDPCDDVKYFSLFKPEIMEDKNQNQMINNIGMNYDTGNNNMNNNMNNNNMNNMNYENNNMNYNMNNMNYEMNIGMNYDIGNNNMGNNNMNNMNYENNNMGNNNMNNNMGNNYMNNNMNNMNNNINNNNMGNNYMNNNMNNMNNNMGNNYMNNNMNYDIGNNYMNNNMNNMNNMTYDNNNMNYTINYDVNKMNNDNNNYMNITNYDNNNMNYNNNNMNIGMNYDDGNNNNNMNFTNPYLQEQTNMYNPYLNQTTNENNYTLNNPSEIQVKTYSNEPKSILNKKDEFFDMSDTVLEEKKQNILNKNINAINELKKKNISLAMQYIANSIGILKNFPKDKKTDFI